MASAGCRARTCSRRAPPSRPGGADHAAGAADVLDDHLLAEEFRQVRATMRPNTSAPQPAANATTMVSGRVGQLLCADAEPIHGRRSEK